MAVSGGSAVVISLGSAGSAVPWSPVPQISATRVFVQIFSRKDRLI